MFVDDFRESEVFYGHIVERVEESATACKWDTLTISLLCATDTNDASAGEDLKRRRVNTFLVDDHEILVGAFAHFLFELHNLSHSIIRECTFRRNQFLSLVRI